MQRPEETWHQKLSTCPPHR